MNYHILYVEDERAIASGVIRGLESEGYVVTWARSAEEGCTALKQDSIHVLLLDVRLPGMDGFTFCRSVRADGYTIPIIMITARDEEVDRVLGLELGADDYLVKPFSLRELLSRIRALIRRSYGELAGSPAGASPGGDSISAGPLTIDRQSLRAFVDGSEIMLTPTELRFLLHLMENAGVALSRTALIDAVWGTGYVLEDERTVDVHIRHLRQKIERDPSQPQLIQTVRGHGYRFVAKP